MSASQLTDHQPGMLHSYGNTPYYWELAAVVAAGAIHVSTELFLSDLAARAANFGIAIAFGGYLIWRIFTIPNVAKVWGMRTDNLGASLKAHLGFSIVGSLVLIGIGTAMSSVNFSATFWLAALLYPIYGVVQQFALQNLIARNLVGLISNPVLLAIVAAVIFGVSHFPRLELVYLAIAAGLVFTLLYRRFPNLWAVGIAHGILGTLALYMVLGEDPGAEILRLARSL